MTQRRGARHRCNIRPGIVHHQKACKIAFKDERLPNQVVAGMSPENPAFLWGIFGGISTQTTLLRSPEINRLPELFESWWGPRSSRRFNPDARDPSKFGHFGHALDGCPGSLAALGTTSPSFGPA